MELAAEKNDSDLKHSSTPLEKKQSEKSYVSYHPGLSSLQQAQDNYEDVFSDHVPILATIPLERVLSTDDSKDTKHRKSIKILSWNVLQDDIYSGFAPLLHREYEGADQHKKKRYTRIAEGLEKMVQEHRPQFITLQEIFGPHASLEDDQTNIPTKDEFELYQKIQEKLGQNYQAVRVRGDVVGGRAGFITFYDITQFEKAMPINVPLTFNQLGGHPTAFRSHEEGETVKVRLLNVQTEPNHLPDFYEAHINQFLEGDDDPQTVFIVVGDFNCHIAPHSNSQNIATRVVSHRFRDHKLQGAAAEDGCFYSSYSQQEHIRGHHRADIVPLDPSTGKAYEASALQPKDLESLPELQREEIERYRMMIAVDDYYRDRRIIDSKYRILEYEQRLREQFSDGGILVRPASNLNNHQKIGLLLDMDLCQCIQLIGGNKFQFQQDQDILGDIRHYIYVDRVDTGALLSLTDKIATNTNLIKLSANIVKLKENMDVDRNIVQSLEALLKSLGRIPLNESIAPIIIDHFIQESEAIARNPSRSANEIKLSAAGLDARLFGKPPMNWQLKTFICWFIASCLGAVMGVVFSALTSMEWGGGFGEFAESFADRFSDVNDVGLATGTGVLGCAGAVFGFFSARSNAADYDNRKLDKKFSRNDQDVLASVDNVNRAIAPKASRPNR